MTTEDTFQKFDVLLNKGTPDYIEVKPPASKGSLNITIGDNESCFICKKTIPEGTDFMILAVTNGACCLNFCCNNCLIAYAAGLVEKINNQSAPFGDPDTQDMDA